MLRDISLEIKAGETVAIVGATDSGKTTLINILSRFYPYAKLE
ncbi:ATP-binding cassette domain-containing protein [Citrobacter youngae]|nr:ATP-binding cassette domain-containing protein [Citrobacter youngae]